MAFPYPHTLLGSVRMLLPMLGVAMLWVVPAAGQTDWTTHGASFQRTFHSDVLIPQDCALNIEWISQGDSVDSSPSSSIWTNVVVSDTLAFLCFERHLACFDVRTGDLVWNAIYDFPIFGEDMRCNATVDDSLVYVSGGTFRSMNCLRVADGSLVWSHNATSTPPPLGNTLFGPTVVKDSVLYWSTDLHGGEIFAVNKYTGVLFLGWATNPMSLTEGRVFNAFTSDGDSLLFVGTFSGGTGPNAHLTNGRLYAIRLSDGTVKWELEDPSAKFLDPVLDEEGFTGFLSYEAGVLYYQSNIRDDANGFDHFPRDGSVGAIDVNAEDGTGIGILWVTDAPIGRAYFGGPTIGDDMLFLNTDGIFISDTNPKGVVAVDKSSGNIVWHNRLDSSGVPLPVSIATGADSISRVFAGTRQGNWYMLDGSTGEIQWTESFSGVVHGTAIVDRGILVSTRNSQVGNGNGQLALFSCVPCSGLVPGDVDCDGVVDLRDLVHLGNILDGLIAADSCSVCTADEDSDGDIDEDDYSSLYEAIAQ